MHSRWCSWEPMDAQVFSFYLQIWVSDESMWPKKTSQMIPNLGCTMVFISKFLSRWFFLFVNNISLKSTFLKFLEFNEYVLSGDWRESFLKILWIRIKISEIVLGINRGIEGRFCFQYQLYVNMWPSTVLYIGLLFSYISNLVSYVGWP